MPARGADSLATPGGPEMRTSTLLLIALAAGLTPSLSGAPAMAAGAYHVGRLRVMVQAPPPPPAPNSPPPLVKAPPYVHSLRHGLSYTLEVSVINEGPTTIPSPFLVILTTDSLQVRRPYSLVDGMPGTRAFPSNMPPNTGQGVDFVLYAGQRGRARISVLLFARRGDFHSFLGRVTWRGVVH